MPGFNIACTFTITLGEEHNASVRELRTYPKRSATAWMQRRIAASGADVVELLKIYQVLLDASLSTVREDFLCWMTENRPLDPHLAALRAAEHARAERWAEVRQMLEGVDLQTLLQSTVSMLTISSDSRCYKMERMNGRSTSSKRAAAPRRDIAGSTICSR